MSCCKNLTPFPVADECKGGYGGIKRIWVACASTLESITLGTSETPIPYNDGAEYPIDTDLTSGLSITAFSGIVTSDWIQLPIKKNASTFASAGSGDISTPITVVNTITAVIKSIVDFATLKKIVDSQLVAIVQFNDGTAVFIGYFEPAVAVPNYDAGTAMTDPAITTISIVQNDIMLPIAVASSAVPTV